MDRLSDEDFARVVRLTPLVAIDLVIYDEAEKMLLGRRKNEPAKGMLFAPGGRIRKSERLSDAFQRILADETGLSHDFSDARLLGAFDHIYETNTFQQGGFGTHYVTLGYEIRLGGHPAIRLDGQHDDFVWMRADEILAAPDVHANTRNYVRR